MDVRFYASESISLAVEETPVPIQHYLRQPQRLVNAIADPNLTEQLSPTQYRLKMRPISFMDLYYLQPTVTLKVWTDAKGNVFLYSEDCEILGIDYINERFSLNVVGKLSPSEKQGKMYLQGIADLEVTVELPFPLQLMPRPLLEVTGNRLLSSVLLRIKQRLLSHLLKDYRTWANNNAQTEIASQAAGFTEANTSVT